MCHIKQRNKTFSPMFQRNFILQNSNYLSGFPVSMRSLVSDYLIALLVNQEFILSKGYILYTILQTRWVVMLHNQMEKSCFNGLMTLLTSPLSFSLSSEVNATQLTVQNILLNKLNMIKFQKGTK